ncbi:MAG TPA: hypothetical protein VF941_04725 [Clostridia bacterium]
MRRVIVIKTIKPCMVLIIALIIFIMGGFFVQDLSRLINLDRIRLVATFLSTVLVFTIRRNSLSRRDFVILILMYINVCIADILFSIHKEYFGIIFFIVFQFLYVLRLNVPLLSPLRLISLLSGTIIAFCSFFYNYSLNLMIAGYSIILISSLIYAILNYKRSVLPLKNSKLLLYGIVLFFVSDITTGLNFKLSGLPYLISSSITWMLYTPSLTLIALSGYRFAEPSEEINSNGFQSCHNCNHNKMTGTYL